MQDSIISWTKKTWNPSGGCSRVSDGCKFCYAEALSHRYGWTKTAWTLQNESENVVIKPHKLHEPFTIKEPSRVFVNSMSDLFHRVIPDWYRAAVFNVMLSLPQHTFQVLTKRPEATVNWHLRYLEAVKTPEYQQFAATHPNAKVRAALSAVYATPWGNNIWMGTSVEDRRVVSRIDALRQCGAKVRFLSCEPLIGPLGDVDLSGIHWVIAGGESGQHLTDPSHPRWLKQEWARELRDRCVAQGVAFFYKQDSGRVTELRPYLVEADGTFWRWWQYPGDLAKPVQVNAKGEPLPVTKPDAAVDTPSKTDTEPIKPGDAVIVHDADGDKSGTVLKQHDDGTVLIDMPTGETHGYLGGIGTRSVDQLSLAPTVDNTPCVICGAADTTVINGKPICHACNTRIEAYQSRVQSRLERLQASAEKAQAEARRDLDRAEQMASIIPFGQPILRGHHSEKWDTNYRNRIDKTWRRGFEMLDKVKGIQQRIQAAQSNEAISSDDPEAVLKLQAKIEAAEAEQAHMKQANSEVRKVLKLEPDQRVSALAKALGISEAQANTLLTPDDFRRVGYPDYKLTNNNANIRRMKERLTELQAKARRVNTEPDAQPFGDVTLERDPADNRLRLRFPGKPAPDVIALLKRHGFIWSGLNSAWQRQLNNASESAAKQVLMQLGKVEAQPVPTFDTGLTYDQPQPKPRNPILCADCGHDFGTPDRKSVV